MFYHKMSHQTQKIVRIFNPIVFMTTSQVFVTIIWLGHNHNMVRTQPCYEFNTIMLWLGRKHSVVWTQTYDSPENNMVRANHIMSTNSKIHIFNSSRIIGMNFI